MHAHDPDTTTAGQQVNTDGTTRFESRQGHNVGGEHFYPLADEHGIAVPADAVRPGVERHCPPRALVDQLTRQGRHPSAKATVGLLKRDNICVDFMQNAHDAFGITSPVEPDRLMDVVTGNGQHGAAVGPRLDHGLPMRPGSDGFRLTGTIGTAQCRVAVREAAKALDHLEMLLRIIAEV